MNKRIQKKYLSDDERTILRLFHLSQDIDFYIYNASKNNGKSFTKMLGKPKAGSADNSNWLKSIGKIRNVDISATAFLRGDEF